MIHLMLGKLQLVKTLLEKLESLLTDKFSDETVKLENDIDVNTFLDTPLCEFIKSEQVRFLQFLISNTA